MKQRKELRCDLKPENKITNRVKTDLTENVRKKSRIENDQYNFLHSLFISYCHEIEDITRLAFYLKSIWDRY